MVDIVTLIGIAFGKDDESWLSALLLSDYTTPYVIEKVIRDTVVMEWNNQILIDRLFEAHEWLCINKPSIETYQDDALISACLNYRIDLIERIMQKFKKLTFETVEKLIRFASHHNRQDISTLLNMFYS